MTSYQFAVVCVDLSCTIFQIYLTLKNIVTFDQWCLRRILRIPYTAHVTNEEVRRRTGQSPVTSTIVSKRLRLFGHIARAWLRAQDRSKWRSVMETAMLTAGRAT